MRDGILAEADASEPIWEPTAPLIFIVTPVNSVRLSKCSKCGQNDRRFADVISEFSIGLIVEL